MVYKWTRKLISWFFPPTCLLCGARAEGDWNLCADCCAELPRNNHPCQCCAIPLDGSLDLVCGKCQQHPPPFDRAFAPLLYQQPVDYLVKALKFGSQLTIARLLGEWLGEDLAGRDRALPECIIPVPLHPSRLRERGFNQALELARPVSRRLGIPVLPNSVQRIRRTKPQVELNFNARGGNVRGAFAVNRPLPVHHVALIDDVITTGSTVSEVAQVLGAAGVSEIDIWACARTLRD